MSFEIKLLDISPWYLFPFVGVGFKVFWKEYWFEESTLDADIGAYFNADWQVPSTDDIKALLKRSPDKIRPLMLTFKTRGLFDGLDLSWEEGSQVSKIQKRHWNIIETVKRQVSFFQRISLMVWKHQKFRVLHLQLFFGK